MPETQASTPLPGHWQCRPTCKLKRAAFNRRHRDFASQTFRQTPLARQCKPESTLRDARGGQTPETQASTPRPHWQCRGCEKKGAAALAIADTR